MKVITARKTPAERTAVEIARESQIQCAGWRPRRTETLWLRELGDMSRWALENEELASIVFADCPAETG